MEDHAEEILAVIEEQPDLTLDEIVAALRKRKIRKPHGAVSVSGASRRHIKKKSFAQPNRSGRTWLAPAGNGYASRACSNTHLVFID